MPSSFLASSWIDFLYISVEFIRCATRPGGMFDSTDPWPKERNQSVVCPCRNKTATSHYGKEIGPRYWS